MQRARKEANPIAVLTVLTQMEEGPWHPPALVVLSEDRGWGKMHPENPITVSI